MRKNDLIYYSVIVVLCGPDLTVGTLDTELGTLNAVGVIGSQGPSGGGGPWPPKTRWTWLLPRTVESSSNQDSLTPTDLGSWLIDHSVPRSEIYGKPTKFLLHRCKQKSSRSSEQKPNLPKSYSPSVISQTWTSLQTRNILMLREWVFSRKDPHMLPKVYTVGHSPSLPQRDIWPFTRVTVNWEKGSNQNFGELLDTSSELTLISENPRCHCGTYGCQVINVVLV